MVEEPMCNGCNKPKKECVCIVEKHYFKIVSEPVESIVKKEMAKKRGKLTI